jgi:hypothetical protein
MRTLSRAFLAGSVVASAIGAATLARRRRRKQPHPSAAGSMFVGAVEEVELSGPLVSGMNPEGFDPEEVPSEHQEINDLRRKMPMG